MSLTSIFERHRPLRFADMVGNKRAKRVLRNALADLDSVNGFVFTGPKGCGKTSAARIMLRTVGCEEWQTGKLDPCLTCETCLRPDVDAEVMLGGTLRIIRNCAALTLADVKDDFDSRRFAYDMVALYYDEFQRAQVRIQDLLVTYLEAPVEDFFIIISTPNLENVDEALRQRLLPVHFTPPSTEEVVQLVERVAECEKIHLADRDVAFDIAVASSNIPREALNLLQNATFATEPNQPVSRADVAWCAEQFSAAPIDADGWPDD